MFEVCAHLREWSISLRQKPLPGHLLWVVFFSLIISSRRIWWIEPSQPTHHALQRFRGRHNTDLRFLFAERYQFSEIHHHLCWWKPQRLRKSLNERQPLFRFPLLNLCAISICLLVQFSGAFRCRVWFALFQASCAKRSEQCGFTCDLIDLSICALSKHWHALKKFDITQEHLYYSLIGTLFTSLKPLEASTS